MPSSALIEGHKVRALGRTNKCPKGTQPFVWNPETGMFPSEALHGIDVIVRCIWPPLLWESDGRPTTKKGHLQWPSVFHFAFEVELLKANFCGPWIQASAIGIHGHHPAPCDEQTESGSGFLARVASKLGNAQQSMVKRWDVDWCRCALGWCWLPTAERSRNFSPSTNSALVLPLGSGNNPWVGFTSTMWFDSLFGRLLCRQRARAVQCRRA